MEEITSKGYAAELLVRADLLLKGIVTHQPDIPTTEYDIVVRIGKVFKTVQIKGSVPKSDGKMRVDVRRSKGKSRLYDSSSFDILAIVNLETKDVAYIDYLSIGCPQFITLRTSEPPKNGYRKGQTPNMFDDYLNFPRTYEEREAI